MKSSFFPLFFFFFFHSCGQRKRKENEMLYYDDEISKISSHAHAVLLRFVCLPEICFVPVMPSFIVQAFVFQNQPLLSIKRQTG